MPLDLIIFVFLIRVAQSVLYRTIRPWIWRESLFHLTSYGRETKKAMKLLHDFTYKVIAERKAGLNAQSGVTADAGGQALRKQRLAFLDMMLTAQKQDPSLTDEAIREETDTFMFEGHETTAMAICWTLFALGNHLDIQQRVREEVLAAGEEWQKVIALPYLEMVIKESLRLYPPVLYIARSTETDLLIGETAVPAGINIDLIIFLLHRNPEHFPNPDCFDPERFNPDQEKARHPFAYVPFSGGLRNCIGKRYAMMELKLMVAEVLRAFSVKSLHTEDQIEFLPELVLRSKQGIMLHLDPLS